MTHKPDFIETAKKVLQEYHPQALMAFAAGSIVRGEGTSTSDIDLVIIYDDSFENVHRHSIIFDGWPIEMFVHNIKANDYFFAMDRGRGMPIMPTMVYEGVEIPGPSALSAARKAAALKIIEAGPPPLEDIELSRYMLTDLLDDILGAAEKKKSSVGSLALLYQDLGNFYLRANGQWSGRGKSLLRALNKSFPGLGDRYETIFKNAFASGDIAPVVALTDELLQPFGGRYWAGLRRDAPADWKNFAGAA